MAAFLVSAIEQGIVRTYAVAALERKALVNKYADTADGRAVALKAPATGVRATQACPRSFAPVVAGLSETEQESLLGLVVKMIRQLQQRQLIALKWGRTSLNGVGPAD